MRYRTTLATRKLLEDLNHLSVDVEHRLDLASAAARGEWREIRSRFPTAQEMDAGFTAISEEDLLVMRAKIQRFREILVGRRPASVRLGIPRVVLESDSATRSTDPS